MKTNRHHPIHDRISWTSRPQAEYIREHPSLIFETEIPLHNEIHRMCPTIPLLGIHALQQTANLWKPDDYDQLNSLGNLQLAMERTTRHPKAHEIEQQLTRLAIQAIELQKPYLKEAISVQRFYSV